MRWFRRSSEPAEVWIVLVGRDRDAASMSVVAVTGSQEEAVRLLRSALLALDEPRSNELGSQEISRVGGWRSTTRSVTVGERRLVFLVEVDDWFEVLGSVYGTQLRAEQLRHQTGQSPRVMEVRTNTWVGPVGREIEDAIRATAAAQDA